MRAVIIVLFGFSQIIWAQQHRLVLPIGHTSWVKVANFSRDDTKVITASLDNTAKVWDAKSGALLTDLIGHKYSVSTAYFSPDASKVLTSSWDNTAKIWDSKSGKILLDLVGHEDDVYSARYSPDGSRVVTASADATAKIWDAATGNILFELKGHTDAVYSAYFSPDGRKIITVSWDNTAIIWDANTGIKLVDLVGHTNRVYAACFSPDGSKVVTTSRDNTAKIWDGFSGKIIAELIGHTDYVESAKFSTDGTKVLTASWDNTAKIWDGYSGKLLKDLNSHIDRKYSANIGLDSTRLKIYSLGFITANYAQFSADGTKILTKTYADKVKIWDGSTGNMLAEIPESGDQVYTANFNATGTRIITASWNNSAKIWDAKTIENLVKLIGHTFKVQSCSYSPDGKKIITTNWDNSAKLWDATTGKMLINLNKHSKAVLSGNFSPDGKKIITTSNDGTAKVWDVESGLLLIELIGHFDIVYSGNFSSDGKKIVTASADNTVKVWNAATGDHLYTLYGHTDKVVSADFSPDGTKLVTASWDNQVLIWNLLSKKLQLQLSGHNNIVNSARFSPDGKTIVSASDDNSIKIWDASTGDLRMSIVAQSPKDDSTRSVVEGTKSITLPDGKKIVVSTNQAQPSVYAANFNFEGTKIVTASNDGIPRIWDATSGKLLLELKAHSGGIMYASFNPDGTRIITASQDNMSKIWDANSGACKYTFFSIDSSDYFNQLPTGYYQSTPEAAKLLHYVTPDLKVITFEQLDVKYNRPDKVLRAIGNNDTAMIQSCFRAYQKRIQKLGIDTTLFTAGFGLPEAQFVNRDAIEYEQRSKKVALRIGAIDTMFLLDRFNIWVNEVPLYGQRGISIRNRKTHIIDTTVTIELSEGDNKIETSVLNINGAESYRTPLFLKLVQEKKETQKVHFIGIGINRFANPEYNLNYSVKDIRDLASKLRLRYKDTLEIDTLFNENLTIINVAKLKYKLLRSRVNDKVIIAFSGHGLLSKDFSYYLSTYTVDFEHPEISGLPYEALENLLDSIPARQKLMLIDACHSGEVDKEELVRIKQEADSLGLKGVDVVAYEGSENGLGLKNSFELMQELFVNVSKGTGATIISASGGTQFALEKGDLQNGVFTYSILEAMQSNSSITVSQLKERVGKRVVELTNGMQKPTNRTETISWDWRVW